MTLCEDCGTVGHHYCDGYGQIVHPPSAFDRFHGESRRLHTRCPGCERCMDPDDPRRASTNPDAKGHHPR